MRALLVDDERLARARLLSLLDAHPEIEVIGQADGRDSAIAQLQALRPDVVFLDVQMPPHTGFDVMSAVEPTTRVVFVTAHDEHAVRAFEVNALDYLLKPVDPERLAQTVSRLQQPREAPAPVHTADRIRIDVGRGMRFVAVADLVYIAAEGDYTEIFLLDGTSVLTSTSMREWERRLPADAFARIHRSTIVAIAHAVELRPAAGTTHLLFVRGREAPLTVSRARFDALRERLRR